MEIGVKIVGPIPASSSTDKNNDPQPRNFTITVEPEDAISTLHKQIEAITGLETPQQRLIYRGRVIGARSNGTCAAVAAAAGNQNHSSNEDDPKELRICDVAGLSDGHMIHLVPRPASETSDSTDSASGTATATTTTGTTRSGQSDNPDLDSSEPTVIRGSGGAGLLAALLGMGISSGGSRGNDDGEEGGSLDIESLLSSLPMGSPTPRPAARSLRRRPNSHRRTAADQLYPTPCPLEPVRQGIMTLHTMIGGQSADDTSDIHSAPFHAKRMFYRGQWLDVRDTVNQWLEATVVEVLTPDEILQRAPRNVNDEHGMNSASASYMQGKRPATDPAIGSNDHEGRLRLLLEEGEDESDRTLADLNHDDDLIGWKERENNDNLQIILVHYNGWPHRWDEWIRSDSDRIRPFRTRSKHQPTRDHVSPSPDSTFHSAPSTFIKSEEDKVDAHAILPELHRALASVQNLFAGAIREEDPSSLIRRVGTDSYDKTLSRMEQSNLANAMKSLSPGQVEEVMRIVQGTHEGGKNMDPADIDILELDDKTQLKLKNMLRPSEPDDSPQNQLPWKSKCSYTGSRNDYDDDGPHMSRHQREDQVDFDKKKLEALAPLLDRLGRIMVDIAPHVASVADSLPQEVVETSEDAEDAEISIMDSISRQLRPSWSSEGDETESRTGHEVESHSDYVDFVNGFVNFRNNNTSANRRSRSNNSDSSIGSSLLSAYLSSAMNERASENGDEGNGDNGPRVVRIGGGGTGGGGRPGGGVDIHIHAVVTGPGGMPMQGLPDLEGMSNLLNTNPTANNSDNGTNNRTTANPYQPGIPTVSDSTVAEPDDDDGLFDDLYSEYPNQDRNPHASWRNMEEEIIDDASESEVGLLQEMTMNNNASSSSSLMRQQNVDNSSSNVLDTELEDRSDGDSEDDKISPPQKTEDDSDSSDNDSQLSDQPPNAIANERDIACIPPNNEQHDAKEELEHNRIKEDVEPEQQQQDSNESHIDDMVNRGEHILDGAHSENLREDTARRVPIFSRIFRRAINRRPSSSHGRD